MRRGGAFMYSKLYLQRKIELLRREMTDIAFEKGFSDEQAVKVSQELDVLLNEYNKGEQLGWNIPPERNHGRQSL